MWQDAESELKRMSDKAEGRSTAEDKEQAEPADPSERRTKKGRKPRADKSIAARTASPLAETQQPFASDDGYNAKLISFMAEITPETRFDKTNIPAMRERFNRYLQKCAEYGVKVGNQSAYFALGINKQTVSEILVHNRDGKDVLDFLKFVKDVCALYREHMMADSKVNPVVGIFWQKNYDGFRDQQEVVVTPNQPLGDDVQSAELAQKYLNAVNSDE